ncbi:hypothetical protein TNIN_372371 [Trichonephila inaurata madagascariensis]|uniref:Uncharacterized protein n=1 Tax=Trichonephila inaurata madagascariensis TaxID=2747483 RepID=A0A8X6WS34_9ARAC|nr:hypothetical protein TNIN_372371 [Trichonephila inaurata madagascariensis]
MSKLKKYSSETINRLKSNSEHASLDPYTTRDLEHNSLPRREIVYAIQTRSQRKKREAEQNRTSKADEKEEMKLEENLAEDIENLLPSFKEEKDTKSLININTDEFIKAQQKSEN